MQFIYPNVLWALLAIALPIIIHLFNFRKYTTVYFSNVAFLKNIQKESKSKSRLKNLIVLLLRCLAIALLVLVFAKPYIPLNDKQKITEQSHAIVYIDNSFSMDADGKYGILLETAKLKARELASLLPRNTKFLLVTNEFLPVHQRYVGGEQFVEWVSQIKSTHIVRNLNEIMLKTSMLLPADTALSQKLYILSDFQDNFLNNYESLNTGNLNIVAMKVPGNPVGNLYIDSVWLETPGHYKGKEEKLVVKVVNQSEIDHTDIPLTLYINDSIRSSVVFNISTNKSALIELPFTLWRSGTVLAHVELTDYPITFDNKFYFNFEINDKKKVLILNGLEQENYFKALFNKDENLVSTTFSENAIPYNTFGNYEIVFVNQLTNLSTGLTNELFNFIEKGGSLVFIPSGEANLQSYNSFTAKFGLNYKPSIKQNGLISNIDVNHTVFDATIESELAEARFPEYHSYFPLSFNQSTSLDKLFYSESGDPLFIRLNVGEGDVFVSALAMNESNTDLALHPLFVPLMYNIALYSSKSAGLFYWIRPETIAKSNAISNTIAPTLTNVNTGVQLMPSYNLVDNLVYLYPEIDKLNAGHYRVSFGSDRFNGLSYNYDRDESNMSFKTVDEITNMLGLTDNVNIIELGKNKLEQHMVYESMGRNLSGLFLWILVIVVLLEMLVLRFF